MSCPHDDIRFCPLYVASHEPAGLGCIRNGRAEFECAVDRGRLDYTGAVGRLYRELPDLVTECRVAEQQYEAGEQRRRNLQHNGIH